MMINRMTALGKLQISTALLKDKTEEDGKKNEIPTTHKNLCDYFLK